MPQTAEAFLEDTTNDAQIRPSAEEFLAEAPSAEAFLEAPDTRVAQMADATRHTVGVVGRAVAALDVAQAGANAPESGRFELDQPDESSLAPTPGDMAPIAARREAIQPLEASSLLAPMFGRFPRVTAQEVSDALSMLASGSPDLTQEESEAVIEHTTAPGNLEKIVAGAQRAAINIPEAATTPLGVATLGAGALPAGAGRVVSGAFAVDMARHIPEQVVELRAAIASKDSGRITEASGNLFATGLMTAAAAKHAAFPKPIEKLTEVAPLTANAVAETGHAPRETVPATITPLTSAAIKSVKEPVLETPAPTPAAATSELGNVPARTGTEPPAKSSVTPDVTVAKAESEQALTTGIKNAAVDSERQSRGLEPIMAPQRLANTEVWDSAMARIEKEPGWQDRLVEELKEKPRTPNAEEVVALDHRYVELQNEHAKAARDGAAHQEAGFAEGVQEATARAEFYEKELAKLEEVAHNIGTEWGRSGQMRQRLMNEDFSLAAIESRARAKNAFEPLTETEHAEIKTLHGKLSAASERMAMLEAQKALAEAKVAAQPTYGPQVLAAAERFASFMDQKGVEALGRIKERLGRTSAGIDPTILSDVGILGAAKITRGVVDFAKWTDAMVRDLGEWFREHAREGWDASHAALEQEKKDFGQAKKRHAKLDHQTNLARAEAEMRRDDIRRRLAKFEYEQKTRGEKIWHGIKTGRNAIVNIASSYDFSAPRQALLALLSNINRLMLPIEVAKNAKGRTSLSYVNQIETAKTLGGQIEQMFSAWSSEGMAGAIEQKRLARPNAKSGADKIAEVHYSELTSKLNKYEENAHSILDEWARLPLKTGNLAKTVATAPVKVAARGVRASNRAFITFLNSVRADLLDQLLATNFKDRAPTTADLKVIGNYVNIATGRGKLPPKGAAVASNFIWSPYLLSSRVQALTGQPLWTGKWAESGRARAIVAKEYARIIMSGYLLWNVSRLFDEKDEKSPTSSDFGKIVRGNTRIDPWGGFQQVTTVAARTASATTTTLKGKERDIGTAKKYWQRGLWHTWADFGRSKLRPDVGAAVDFVTRSDFVGRPTTPGHLAESLLVPLPLRDIVGVMKEHGFTEGMIIEALGQFGAGVSQYEDSEAQR